MSNLLRTSELTPQDQPGSPALPASSATIYDQLLSSLGSTRKAVARGHLVGVTACRPRDGATHVALALATHAARQGKRVLYAEAAPLLQALAVPPVDLLDSCIIGNQPRLWRLPATRRIVEVPTPELETLQRRLQGMRSVVDLVVLDMGSVTTGGHILRLSSTLDDLLLVVAAAETRRPQIAYAQRLLAHAGGTLTGCVLNKRTYPLPSALFRALN